MVPLYLSADIDKMPWPIEYQYRLIDTQINENSAIRLHFEANRNVELLNKDGRVLPLY